MIGNRAWITDIFAGDGIVVPAQVKADGFDAVCIKMGEGNWYDPNFVMNWGHFKGVLPRQAYWLIDDRWTLASHIAAILAGLGTDPGEIPLLIDYEDIPSLNVKLAPVSWVQQIDAAHKAKYGYHGILYSRNDLWIQAGGPSQPWALDIPWFDAWYPYYPDPIDGGPPTPPAPFKTWLMWQYCESGPEPGFQSLDVDKSVWNGSVTDMNNWLVALHATPTPIPTPAPVLSLEDRVARLEAAATAHGWTLG